MQRTWFVGVGLIGTVCLWLASPVQAQNSSLYAHWRRGCGRMDRTRTPDDAQMNLAQGSWIYTPTPPPREIQIHDVISVRVDMLARMAAEGELRRRKNGNYDARLNDWLIFDGLRWMKPSPQSDGDPRVRGELRSQYRSLGELETAESLAFNIACEVIGHPSERQSRHRRADPARINDEVWTITLSGIVPTGVDRTE